jgi:hypothetical protein
MRLGAMIMAYFMIGALLFVGGAVPAEETGLVTTFVDFDDQGVNEEEVSAGEGGMLSNLVGPVENALNTVAGGGLIAALNKLDSFLGFVAWPWTVMSYWNAPFAVRILVAGPLTVAFTIGGLRVLRSSI